jgi:hypothetical protein
MVDILPRNIKQIIFTIFIYIVNLIAYSTIIGVFIETLALLKERDNKAQDQIDNKEVVMNRISVPQMLVETI